jgi:adenylate cyclase
MKVENYPDQIEKEIIQGEYSRLKLFIIALIVGFLIMGFLFFGLQDVDDFFKNPFTPAFIMIWIFTFILYEYLMFLIVRWRIRHQKSKSIGLKIFNIFVETLFPGFLLLMLCLIESTPIFLDSPLFLFYFILIILSALHLDVKLALLTGVLSALSYLGVTIWAINTFDPNFETMHLHPFLYEIRSAFILTGGLCAVFVSNEIKKRIIRVGELREQKTEIEGLFSQQVSPQVVEALVNDKHHTDKPEVSILFLDIRDFTSFSEQKNPQEVIGFQNDLFGPLIEIINNHNGIVNQIMGDGFMATFGAPVKDQDHTLKAVNSGLEMLEAIEKLVDQGIIPPTRVGIGVHTGQVITGNIGNEIRKQYSVSGTTVIIAARLEQLNKQLNTNFLVSKEVYEKVKGEDCSFSRFKEIQLKGIEKPIEVYQVTKSI